MTEQKIKDQAKLLALEKLLERNPDEYEQYYLQYYTKLKEEEKNGKTRDD